MSTRIASMTSSVSSSLATFGRKPQRPDSRMAKAVDARAPVWPTVSIVMLLAFSALLPPLFLTVMNATLVVLALLLALVTNEALDRRLAFIVLPFALIILIGMAAGIGADRYNYFKDVWYVLNPVLVIATGYVLFMGKPDLARGLRAFVIGGMLVALWQVRAYFIQPDIILLPTDTIRRFIGTGYYAPVLGVVILMVFAGQWRSALKLPTWLGGVFFVLLATSVTLMFSRTALLVIVIGLIAWIGCFAKNEWLRLGPPLLVAICIAFALQLYVDVDSDRALKTFIGKLARTVSELTVSDYSALRDISLSFRGHETAQALRQYAAGPWNELLFGRGFGATVDLGVFLPIELNEAGGRVSVRFIGVLHNGYAYLLTKAGAVSVLLYVFALAYLYLVARAKAALPMAQMDSRIGRLLQAAVVTLATTTYIVGGVFNKLDMFPFMLLTGYLLAYLRPADA